MKNNVKRNAKSNTYFLTIGAINRGVKIMKVICEQRDSTTTTSLLPTLYHTLYNDLHVLETHYHGGDFIGNHCHKILKYIDKILQLLFDGLPEQIILSNYFNLLRNIATIATKIGGLSDDEISNLSTFCNQFGKLVRSDAFRAVIPEKFHKIPLKIHLIEADILVPPSPPPFCLQSLISKDLVDFATQWHALGSYSESFNEPVHHIANLTPTNPRHTLENILHYNRLATSPLITKFFPQVKQRHDYYCGYCLKLGHVVLKKDHLCPNKPTKK
jgi:hypothetical protein